ncbi:MAG TPA: PQQ-like beta-propeller repeat protein [Clostridiaceae bacterium]|nr:PQQ-like beta-propeller repeat protein [Clostridiaceae bacterium]
MNKSINRGNKKVYIRKLLILVLILSNILLTSCDLYVQEKYDTENSFEQAATNDIQENLESEESQNLPADKQNTEESVEENIVKLDVFNESYSPSDFQGYNYWVLIDGKPVETYSRKPEISFPKPENYSLVQGITTFRGNNFRNTASFGHVEVTEKKLEAIWFTKIGYIDTWTGVGWNGQPVIVKWDDEVKNIMNIFPAKKEKDNLVEVIYGTLDGKIYFLDLEDGNPTREPIDIGYPIKGSVAVDPRGFPLLYTGQGISEKNGEQGPIGFRIFSLIDQKQLLFIDGIDPHAYRLWGAFDSVPLVDGYTDTLLVCGENGIVYTVKLNTDFNLEKATISISPEIVKYRYTSPFGTRIGVENSPAVYKNFVYFADNSGLFQCLDINTMKPVWARNVTDDTDSTTVLEEISPSDVFLYTACEVDKQGLGGFSFMRKINALTGELLWEKSIECVYDTDNNGGALATPIVGKNEIDNLVIFNIGRTGSKGYKGTLLALDKNSGREIWKVDMDYYSWSSPVDIYTKSGKAYIIICDSGGYMRLLDGKTGKEYYRIPLEANIEGSPAVFGNIIVVGTRGQKIWGIKIK